MRVSVKITVEALNDLLYPSKKTSIAKTYNVNGPTIPGEFLLEFICDLLRDKGLDRKIEVTFNKPHDTVEIAVRCKRLIDSLSEFYAERGLDHRIKALNAIEDDEHIIDPDDALVLRNFVYFDLGLCWNRDAFIPIRIVD